MTGRHLLQPEIGAAKRVVLVHGRDRAEKTDAAAFERVDVISDLQKLDVLLGNEKCEILAAELRKHTDYSAHDQRRQPGRRLIHDQKARISGKRFCDAEHLALPPGQVARERTAALCQDREYRVELFGASARQVL